jgi:hypothetical protein
MDGWMDANARGAFSFPSAWPLFAFARWINDHPTVLAIAFSPG